MDGTQLTHLIDRLAVRLDDRTLTRYQLIDIATVLVFVRRDLLREFAARGSTIAVRTAIDDLNGSLSWMLDHAGEAPGVELRAQVTLATRAVSRILGWDASRPRPNPHRPSRERAHA